MPEHIKNRLLGHWGSSPGLSFMYVHLNRLIKKYALDMIFIAGPGHGAPGVLGPAYLEGTYSEIYPEKSQDLQGLREFFKQFSFPGGIGSHCTPETPGSIHEGGELGYSLSHACGAAFDNPDLIVATAVGDGESETGPLATSWHINKFLSPVRDGAVLPILHLNGYKINNPTLPARISRQELESMLGGYGWTPYFVEGSEIDSMHQAMAATTEHCIQEIRDIQQAARGNGATTRPRWPMIVLRSPKGWTAPREVEGHYLEGFWRAHQVPLPNAKKDPEQLQILEKWMHSLKPDLFFDENGKLHSWFSELAPSGDRRMSANPHANGGRLKKALRLPDFRNYAQRVEKAGKTEFGNTTPLGVFLGDVMKLNMHNFRVFGPDETASNRLDAIYKTTKKFWIEELFPEDSDGSELARDGRVIEMLSEHTLEGMLEGYLLTGRHGFFSCYEAFVHIIDSMFNQHAKWLEICRHLSWRQALASLNLLITSTVWRQDHNGFTHQDPGFLDVVVNKSANVTRIYLPPDVNCLLSVADHCLRSENYVNVIVCDKQKHLQYLNMDQAIVHCTKGIGIWDWASTDEGGEPDVVMASAGDIPTQEALAATALLRKEFPDLKIRFINVVDLLKLQPHSEHPHGLSDWDFDSLFTIDKPVIFNFHGYPQLIHGWHIGAQTTTIFTSAATRNMAASTPLWNLPSSTTLTASSLAMDVVNRVPRLQRIGGHAKDRFLNQQIECLDYAHHYGIDNPDAADWTWPF